MPQSRNLGKAVFCCLLMGFGVKQARADRRCPLPQPMAAGDTKVAWSRTDLDKLPDEVRDAIANFIPGEYGYRISFIAALSSANFFGDKNTKDYLVFFDNTNTARSNADTRNLSAVFHFDPRITVSAFWIYRPEGDFSWETGLADIRPEDLIIYSSSVNGRVYTKTIGNQRDNCWENIISWDGANFVNEIIPFFTSDGFNYPVNSARYPADIQTVGNPIGNGWKIDEDFQDCNPNNVPKGKSPCTHLGEDWNDVKTKDSDLGHPVFAVSRGEVIFADDAGVEWNGIVILRHRLPDADADNAFSFYAHLNIDPTAIRNGIDGDRSKIKTLGEVLISSSPGHIVEVEKGQLIGYIGPTPKNSTWPHLHFEIIVNPDIIYNSNAWRLGYLALNGDESRWTNPSKFIAEHRSYSQDFEVGNDRDNVGAISAAFIECYNRSGGANVLGKPIAIISKGQSSVSGTAYAYQRFENGEIQAHLEGPLVGHAFAILNPFLAKLKGYPIFGLPTSDISGQQISHSGAYYKFQNFEDGALEFHQSGLYAGEIFEVHGAIFHRWASQQLRYDAIIGLPISDEQKAVKSPLSGKTGRFSVFQKGIIHWIREDDKTYVIGINQDIGGRYNYVQAIADRYRQEGGSGGKLGFPISDDYLSQGGIRCDFEGGYIVYPLFGDLQVVFY